MAHQMLWKLGEENYFGFEAKLGEKKASLISHSKSHLFIDIWF